MALQHELRNTRVRVPELHATILGAAENPIAVRCKCDAKHEVLVALESADAFAAWSSVRRHEAVVGCQLPHLDRLVETAADETVARRRKGDTVDAVLVALLALEFHNKLSALDIPNTDALVERTGGDEAVVGRDGHRSDTILDGEVGDLVVPLEIPQANTAIAAAGCNDLAVAREVERIDVLFVAGELMLDLAAGNIPHLHRKSAIIQVKAELMKLTRMTLSSAPVARYWPLGLKHTLLMYRSPSSGRLPSCRCATGFPVSTSKI